MGKEILEGIEQIEEAVIIEVLFGVVGYWVS